MSDSDVDMRHLVLAADDQTGAQAMSDAENTIKAALDAVYAWRDAVVLCVTGDDADEVDPFPLAEARHQVVEQAIRHAVAVGADEWKALAEDLGAAYEAAMAWHRCPEGDNALACWCLNAIGRAALRRLRERQDAGSGALERADGPVAT